MEDSKIKDIKYKAKKAPKKGGKTLLETNPYLKNKKYRNQKLSEQIYGTMALEGQEVSYEKIKKIVEG